MDAIDFQSGCPCNTPEEIRCYEIENKHIVSAMFGEMDSACTNNQINGNFIREMIPHHIGAVRMSENALRFPLCRELVPILELIISSQKKGICQMRQLLPAIRC